MENLTTFDLLAMHEFIADFPAGWLRRMAVCGHGVTYAPGDRLFREDGPADRLWLVHNGDVVVDLHVPGRGDVAVDILGAGSVLGWEALVPPFRWGFGAVALREVHAVEFRAAAVRGFLGDDPDLGREFYARLLARVGGALQGARQRLVEVYTYPPG
ncbi:cyclic nucleotide-binding domain-containing protein [Actinoplanes sp. NPDC049802]|uniref:Crp/Fnr family transcriptional regulator n=1 Tax=Actinoplanes sp. NPDC049802 TaxID=3154742 RepID=UPI0034082B2A